MIIPLPTIREPGGDVTQGFIGQLHAGEDPRVKEEGVGIESKPQAK